VDRLSPGQAFLYGAFGLLFCLGVIIVILRNDQPWVLIFVFGVLALTFLLGLRYTLITVSAAGPASTSPSSAGSPVHLVLLVHGINTVATWQDELQALARREGLDAQGTEPLRVVPVDIGIISPVLFAFPLVWRWAPVRRFLQQYDSLRAQYPNCRMSVVAHSFGTYVVYRALRWRRRVSFDCMIMAGSLLKRAPNWGSIFGFGGRPKRVNLLINDIAVRDHWVLLARVFIPFMGPSGLLGFRGMPEPEVTNRRFAGGHNDLLTEEHYKSFWLPVLTRREITRGPGAARDVPRAFRAVALGAGILRGAYFMLLLWLSGLLFGVSWPIAYQRSLDAVRNALGW
jgi:hypothetical protein